MTSIDGRIVAALDRVAREEISNQSRDTTWAVVAHVCLNLIRYRAKGAVVATDSWLHTMTGFSADRCGTAVRRACTLGVLTDETTSRLGDYVRSKARPASGVLSEHARVVCLGVVQDGATPTLTLPGARSQDGGAVPAGGGVKTGVEGQDGGQLVPRRGTVPGSVDEGALADESTGTGVAAAADVASERSAHSELDARGWLMDIELEAPVWRRPNTPGAVNAAVGPQGMRLYATLLRYGQPVRPSALATEANMGVKKVRSLLASFKRVGMAEPTPAGWTVGPVRPSEVTSDTPAETPSPVTAAPDPQPAPAEPQPPREPQETTEDEYRPEEEWLPLLSPPTDDAAEDRQTPLPPVPGTDGVIGWEWTTAEDVREVAEVDAFVRPVVRSDGLVDLTRLVLFTDGGRVANPPRSVAGPDITGMEWDRFWEGVIDYDSVAP